MTVSSNANKAVHTGNGVITQFAYIYRMDNDSDMSVYLDEVHQPSGYTVNRDVSDVGGTVDFNTPPATGALVSLVRSIPVTQETDYVEYDAFPAESHEDALDKLTMIIQDLQGIIGGDPTAPSDLSLVVQGLVGYDPNIEYVLAPPEQNTVLGWDATGLKLRNYPSPTSQVGATQTRNSVVAADGQTAVSVGFSYAPNANNLVVYVNGVRQTEYTETSATQVTFTKPLELNDEVLFISNEMAASIGGASGSFTAGSGETITVVNGLITSII